MLEERKEAKNRGSDTTWQVHLDYWIDSGILRKGMPGDRGTLGPSHTYYPFAHPEIVFALANLPEGDEGAVLEFAHRWGHLGYDHLIREHPGWFGRDDSGNEIKRTEDWRGGDPLLWIWAHARTINRILRLIDLLAECEDRVSNPTGKRKFEKPEIRLEEYLSSIAKPYSGRRPPPYSHRTEDFISTHFEVAIGIEPIETIPDLLVASGVTVVTELDPKWAKLDPMTPQKMATEVVGKVITGNLAGIWPMVSPRGQARRTLERNFTFLALIPVVYWHLSDAAIGGKTFVECEWCRKWVLRMDRRQRYCLPLQEGMESLCSLNARQHRWWTKKRSKEAG